MCGEEIICQICKTQNTVRLRQSYGYMGAQGHFYYLCNDCAKSRLKWYHIMPKHNVDTIILWYPVPDSEVGRHR